MVQAVGAADSSEFTPRFCAREGASESVRLGNDAIVERLGKTDWGVYFGADGFTPRPSEVEGRGVKI